MIGIALSEHGNQCLAKQEGSNSDENCQSISNRSMLGVVRQCRLESLLPTLRHCRFGTQVALSGSHFHSGFSQRRKETPVIETRRYNFNVIVPSFLVACSERGVFLMLIPDTCPA